MGNDIQPLEPAQSDIVSKLEKLPWWAGFPASVGASLMGVFAPDVLPDWAPLLFFALGAVLFLIGIIATGWHFLRPDPKPITNASPPSGPLRSSRGYDLSDTNLEGLECVTAALESRKRRRTFTEFVLGIHPEVEQLRATRAALSPPVERWMSLDEAVRYLAKESQWGADQNQSDPNFSVKLGALLRDALACADLTARGRKFHTLHGGVKDPPLHSLTEIPKDFWPSVYIDAYWALHGEKQNIASRMVESVVRSGGHEGIHDVRLEQTRVEALWPPRQNPHLPVRAEAKPEASSKKGETIRERALKVAQEAEEALTRAVIGNSSLRPPPQPVAPPSTSSDDRYYREALAKLEAPARARAAMLARRIGAQIGDPVAMGEHLLEQDARKAAKEAKKEQRRALIEKGRNVVHRFRQSGEQGFEKFASRDRDYLDVQPHLGDEYQAERSRAADRIDYGPEHDDYRAAMLLRELARLEKAWDL
jgi:hypothetical protein